MTGIGVLKNTQSSKLFQAIIENTPAAQFILSGGRLLYANPAFEKLTGYSAAESREMGLPGLFPENSEDAARLQAVLDGRRPQCSFESEITTRAAEKRWVAITFTPIEDLPATTFLGTITDLTDYKRREEAITQSELRYKTVFNMAPDMFVIYDPDGVILDQNEGAFEVFGIPKEEAVYKTGMMTTLCEADKARFPQVREQTLKHGEWRGEFRAVRDLGRGPEFIDFDSHVKVADLGEEKIVICIARDVTERKKMEEQIRQALREKETLLREIHHRVKNNMQIISTLLKLQMGNTADEQTRAMFRESQNRILSMAMIHEKLYQSEGLHRIDLKDYIIDLVREVFTSFGDLSAGVNLKTEIDEIALGLDTAIPCGLIIIELLSNALKYAFPPDHGEGEIFIGLRCEDQGWFGLTISDNGVGLPADVEIDRLKSLGLRLVSDLARYQLDGEMRVSREKGTRVYVKFKEKAKPSQGDDNG
jgi:PAS domain S-box-containing protein